MEETTNKTYINDEQKNWMLTQSYTRLMHCKYEECLTLLKGLEVLCPNDMHVYSMMSYAYLESNNPEKCLEMIEKYKSLSNEEKETKEIQWIQERAKIKLEKIRKN